MLIIKLDNFAAKICFYLGFMAYSYAKLSQNVNSDISSLGNIKLGEHNCAKNYSPALGVMTKSRQHPLHS